MALGRAEYIITLSTMILSGPPGPLGGFLVLFLTISQSKFLNQIHSTGTGTFHFAHCLCFLYCSLTGALIVALLDLHGFGSYWCCHPLREALKLVTDGAFLVFRGGSFHLSATL